MKKLELDVVFVFDSRDIGSVGYACDENCRRRNHEKSKSKDNTDVEVNIHQL